MADNPSELVIQLTVNGRKETATVPVAMTLIELLRDRFALKGTKLSCSRAVCGSCTVLVDGDPVASCALFAFQARNRLVTTIEGLRDCDGALHPIQQAFAERSAFQCGYCTSGMIMLTKALLDRIASPSRAEVVDWLSSNVCRCTGYSLIIDAVMDAAQRLREASCDQ